MRKAEVKCLVALPSDPFCDSAESEESMKNAVLQEALDAAGALIAGQEDDAGARVVPPDEVDAEPEGEEEEDLETDPVE